MAVGRRVRARRHLPQLGDDGAAPAGDPRGPGRGAGRVAPGHRPRAGLRRRRGRPPARPTPAWWGCHRSTVAIGSQVSPLVAHGGGGGAGRVDVLVPEGEFTSVTFPFLAQEARGIRVVEVPLAEIAEHVDGSTGLVALCGRAVVGRRGRPAGRRRGGRRAARGRRARRRDPGRRVAAGGGRAVRLHGVRGLQVAALAPGHRVPHRAPATGGRARARRRGLVRR